MGIDRKCVRHPQGAVEKSPKDLPASPGKKFLINKQKLGY